MMINKNILLTIGCMLSLVLSSCGSAGGPGPRTWIDTPLDGSTLPLAPVVVRSHASSGKWNGFRVPVRQRRAGSGGQRQRPKQPPWLKFHRSGSRMQPEIMFFKLSRPIHRAMKAVRIQSGSILGSWKRSRLQ